MKTELFDGVQSFLLEAGEAACYALCLVKVAEIATGKKMSVIESFCLAIDRGFIYFNKTDSNDNDNFYVKDPAAFLVQMTGLRWSVRKEGHNYIVTDSNEYEIERWERTLTGKTLAHFKLPDWDSIQGGANTVRFGALASKRILRVLK